MNLTGKRYLVLETIMLAMTACSTADNNNHTPDHAKIVSACDGIKALIPESKHGKLKSLENDRRYKSPFSRDVATVIAWLILLYSQVPLWLILLYSLVTLSKQTGVAIEVNRSIYSAIVVCKLALRRQIEQDDAHKPKRSFHAT